MYLFAKIHEIAFLITAVTYIHKYLNNCCDHYSCKFASVRIVLKCDHPVSVTGIVLEVFCAASEDRGSLFQLVTAFCARRTNRHLSLRIMTGGLAGYHHNSYAS